MAKSKTVFRCQQCGFESPKWNGNAHPAEHGTVW